MDQGRIVDVLPGVAATLGVPDAPDPLGLRAELGDVDRVVVVLVDGLGHRLLPALQADAPLLAAVLAGTSGRLRELICTFPSTTPTSLVSFGTGAPPGAHGVLGFVVNIPGTDRLLTHIYWRDDPPPAQWAPVPTWFTRIAATGVDVRAVLPALFVGGGLTRAAYGGARFIGVADLGPAGARYTARLVHEVAAGPGVIFGYTAGLDTAAHLFGVGSPEWHAAGAGVDALLSRLAETLPPRTALVVTADHGGLNVSRRVDLDADPRLTTGVRLVAGEPRVRYLHTVPGAAADVRAAWQAVLGEHAQVLERDEAVAAGLFGPVPAAHRPRIGDVVAICTDGGTAVFASRREPPEVMQLIGVHGGPTPAETAVPLITLTRRRPGRGIRGPATRSGIGQP